MERRIVYLAGPLFTQAEWQWNESLATELRSQGLDVILPQATATSMLAGKEEFDAEKIFRQNVADIHRAHFVVAVLDGPDPDSGTCWECGFAFAMGRPVVGIRTDLRTGGDDAATSTNIMLARSCIAFVSLPSQDRCDTRVLASSVANAISTLAADCESSIARTLLGNQ